MTVDELMRVSPVVSVLTIRDVKRAIPVAKALVAGGLTVLEITLRTPAALEVIAEMTKVEGTIVGAGTVLNERDLDAATKAGARFIVSPGLTEPLIEEARAREVPFLPGVATASDIMRGLDFGLDHFKFFPAETCGGVSALRALAAPFHSCRFCPTGGVTQSNAADWLALDPVLCVGGSWIAPDDSLALEEVTKRAGKAAALQCDVNADL